MIPEDVIASLKQKKSLPANLSWANDGAYTWSRSSLTVQGIGIAGLFLRIKTPNTIDANSSLAQLEWDNARQTHHMARLDWKVGHTNPNIGPQNLRLLTFPSTHFHDFFLNYDQVTGSFTGRNIPIARAVDPDPSASVGWVPTHQNPTNQPLRHVMG